MWPRVINIEDDDEHIQMSLQEQLRDKHHVQLRGSVGVVPVFVRLLGSEVSQHNSISNYQATKYQCN
jgi:hypothetical protein